MDDKLWPGLRLLLRQKLVDAVQRPLPQRQNLAALAAGG